MDKNYPARITLEISLKDIIYNYRCISDAVSPAEVMVVLKANAYGLGIKPIIEALIDAGVTRIGVSEVKEAIEIEQNVDLEILLLGSLLVDEVPIAVEMGIICPITDYNIAQKISEESERQSKTTKCHVLIDTGMGRLGIVYTEAEKEIRKIKRLPNLELEGIYSHFSNANNYKDSKTKIQLQKFRKVLDVVGEDFRIVHMANSDAINNFPKSYFNMVRTGINLYGVFDLLGKQAYQLRSTVSLKTKLIAKRLLPKGSDIGYGCSYTLEEETMVGTIPAGYADGIPYTQRKAAHVLIRGKKCKIIGKVSMDYVTVDLSNCEDAELGETVVIFGEMADEKITVEEWAEIKGTHPYDIICSLGKRVEKVYLS